MVIGHWASLAWRGLGFSWQSVVLCEPGKPPRRRTSVSPSPPPERREVGLEWNASTLPCSFRAGPLPAAVELRLLDSPEGFVDWRCEAPAAPMFVDFGGHSPILGRGYAERLSMTIPPWRLPIRELRWGRWHAAEALGSIVWIEWRGPEPRTWVLRDGVAVEAGMVGDSEVSGDGFHLTLADPRDLEAGALDALFRSIPALRSMVPKPILAMRERRWQSSGTLSSSDAPRVAGEAIHERVVLA